MRWREDAGVIGNQWLKGMMRREGREGEDELPS